MAVDSADPRLSKEAGNDVKLDFDFAFKIFAATDLKCWKVSAAGVYTEGVLNGSGATGFTVDFDTDAETGTVSWVTAPVTGGFSVIQGSELPLTQTATIPREGVTPAATQKNALDKLTLLVQQVWNILSVRAILQAETPVNPDPIVVTETPVDRRALVYEDSGDGQWNIVPSTYDPDAQVILAIAQVALATAQAAAAAASAVAAAISAAAALASQTAAAVSAAAALVSETNAAASAAAMVGTSGLKAARPAGGAVRLYYYATDEDQEYMWSPVAGKWYLVG